MAFRWACGGLLVLAAVPAQATVHYRVALADPARHRFAVTMTVPGVTGTLTVALPAWNATYQIRDFAWRLSALTAAAAGQRLPLVARDAQTWTVHARGTVTLQYRIDWNEPPPFSTQLDPHHAFVNLAEVLLYVPERRQEPVEVEFAQLPAGWRIAAELAPGSCPSCLRAASYDELVDAPVELGTFDEFRFQQGAARLRVVIDGPGLDRQQLEPMLRRIVATETALMREVPFAEYLFIYHVGNGGGGMEHANSTAISLSRPTAEAAAFVTAHEFFHLWNVKRIRPQSLEPVDYAHPMWTRALWFAEGVTSTYAAYTLVRSGLWTPEQFLDHLSGQITELQARPARHFQSAEESSLDAWLEKYPGYFSPERSISYYNKGELLGVLLDLVIRDATDNRRSLDDVLRALNVQFAHRHRFYRDSADLEAVAEQVAGISLRDFFRRYVAGTEEIDWNAFFGLAGLAVRTEPVERVEAGLRWRLLRPEEAEVVLVVPGSPAERAGVQVGDRLLAPPGQRWPATTAGWLQGKQAGETVTLRVASGGTIRTVALTLESVRSTRYRLERLPTASARQQRILDGLLTGRTD